MYDIPNLIMDFWSRFSLNPQGHLQQFSYKLFEKLSKWTNLKAHGKSFGVFWKYSAPIMILIQV